MSKTSKGPKGPSPVSNEYAKLLDGIDKEFNLNSTDLSSARISSGLQSVDLVLGGGYTYGFHVISGQEQSGKTTFSQHLLRDSLKKDIPIRLLRDAEGSTEPTYAGNIFAVKSMAEIFGDRDKNGNWVVPPKVRYSDNNILETVFNSIVKMVNRLPDKVYRRENDSWYYVIEPRDKRTEIFLKAFGAYDKKLKAKTGNYWFPTDNPYPQGIVVLDSLPSLITESVDEKEEDTRGMAFSARAFSQALPRVVGKLSKKNVMILAVNQIREKPGVSFGNPLYEPGGNAIKFYSRTRNQIFARAVPPEWRTSGSTSAQSIEKSLLGDGHDKFAFKHLKNIKNKLGSPYLDCWTRVWTEDWNGEGRGFDLSFDSWMALQYGKLAKEKKEKGGRNLYFEKDLPKSLSDLSRKVIDWYTFRLIVQSHEPLAPRELKSKAEKAAKAANIPLFPLRARLGRQITQGNVVYHPIKPTKNDD